MSIGLIMLMTNNFNNTIPIIIYMFVGSFIIYFMMLHIYQNIIEKKDESPEISNTHYIPELEVISYNGKYVISCLHNKNISYMKAKYIMYNMKVKDILDYYWDEMGKSSDFNFTPYIDNAVKYVMFITQLYHIKYNMIDEYTETIFNNKDFLKNYKNETNNRTVHN